MKPENWISLGIGLLTAAMTGVGLYFGPKLAVRRALEQSRSETWLKEQHDTYNALLQSLSIIRHDNRLDLWAEREAVARSPEHLRQLVADAREHIMKYLDHGSYLISEDAAEALRYVLTSQGDYEVERCENLERCLDKAITVLRAEANIRVKPK